MQLHEGQKKFIRETYKRNSKINILTCANRWGKSVCIACIQLHHLFYKIGLPDTGDDPSAWERAEYRTANLAPHSSNTEAVFKAMHQIMTSSFTMMDMKTKQIRTNKCLIEWFYLKERTLNTPPYKQFFDGNAYIEHRSLGADQGGAIADKPYGLITYDEGGRSDHLELEVRGVILARLFDWSGRLYILSTPASDSKSSIYYYQLYKDGLIGENNTYTMTGSLKDNTFFTEQQINDQYDLYKNDPLRDQVLEGKFVFGGNTIFDTEAIMSSQDETLNDGIGYEEGHKYCIGIDTSIGSDEMVYTVLDITSIPYRLVREMACKGNSKSPQLHLSDLVNLIHEYWHGDNMFINLETWNGESIRFWHDLPPYIQVITVTFGAWQPYKNTFENRSVGEKPGPNAAKKADLIITLQKCLTSGELKIPKNDTKLTDQLSVYSEDDSKLKTDRVMALALAVYRAKQLDVKEYVLEWESVEW